VRQDFDVPPTCQPGTACGPPSSISTAATATSTSSR
jgi:hypothetical protein